MSAVPNPDIAIRRAGPEDAAGVLAIYGPIVDRTAISFELVRPTEREMAGRIRASNEAHRWLVAEADGRIAGYAYGGRHRARAAYDYAAEVSAYIHPDFQGRGLGRRLYEALFAELAGRGFYNAYAGITEPNRPSVGLHKAVGFTFIGIFPRVGFKFGTWHNTSWWHRRLRDGSPERR